MSQAREQRWLTSTTKEKVKVDKRKPKTILFLTYGTRGDIQPLVGIAQELSAIQGFQPYVCTTETHEKFITIENGVPFISCGIHETHQPEFLFDLNNAVTFADIIQALADVYPQLSIGMWDASNVVKPDMIISQAMIRGIGAQISEKLSIPHWSLHFVPSNTPTRAFPPQGYEPSRFPFINKLKYFLQKIDIARAAIKTGLSNSDLSFRRDVLGLPSPLNPFTLLSDIENETCLYLYSPVLCPKPNDWTDWNHVVGFCPLVVTPSPAQGVSPLLLEKSLAAFLNEESKNPLVYLGFGSMEGGKDILKHILMYVAMNLQLRVVVSSDDGEALLCLLDQSSKSRVRVIRSAPHTALFPHCQLIIHHGGAGTTHTAMMCGVPQIICPLLKWSDQPFWGSTVARLGIGKCCLNVEEEFEPSIMEVIGNESYATRARELQGKPHPNGSRQSALLVQKLFFS